MDPFTLLIIAAIGWAIRNVAEDAWAFARREPSPRIVRQRERQRLAQEHAAATGRPTIPQAIVGRVATRIADRPESSFLRPLREFLAERWADALADAIDKHRQRREERGDQTDTPRTKTLIAQPCDGKCGRYVVSPTTLCPACAHAEAQRPEPEQGELDTRVCRGGCGLILVEPWEWCDDCERAQQPSYRCGGGCGRPVTEPDTWCPICLDSLTPYEHNDPEPVALGRCTRCRLPGDTFDDLGECPECHLVTEEMLDNEDHVDDDLPDQPDETPEPDPAPDTTRKDPTPMSTPTEINGDTTSPLEALAFATSCLDLNTAVQNELDAMSNNLAGEGVGHECIQIIGDALAAAEQFGMSAAGARDEYARHVATQADIAGNTELRDTVAGTYLDSARA